MKRRGWMLILLALWGVALAVLGLLMFGRCRPAPPAPPTATLPAPPNTPTPTPQAQLPTATPTRAQATREATATATIPRTATATPTAVNSTPTATPDLMGHHRVARGDTMWDIGLLWYRGRYFAWGEDVWRPICVANPEVTDCRLIYPGEVLRIPMLPAATPRP